MAGAPSLHSASSPRAVISPRRLLLGPPTALPPGLLAGMEPAAAAETAGAPRYDEPRPGRPFAAVAGAEPACLLATLAALRRKVSARPPPPPARAEGGAGAAHRGELALAGGGARHGGD
eukprot:gene15311-30106_t